MRVKDLYNMLDGFHGLRGLTLIDGENYIMYTVEEAAEVLYVSPRHLYRLLKKYKEEGE